MSRMLDPCKTCEEMTTNGEYCSLNCYLSRDKTEKEAMSGSKGLKRYNGVEQDDEGAYVYYDEHIAALRRAKAEGMREAAMRAREFSKPYFIDWWMLMTKREIVASICRDVADAINARAAQIEAEG